MKIHSWKDYLFLHVLLMDRIHETGILTTEFTPVVLLTDALNGTVIIHSSVTHRWRRGYIHTD